ncbi:MAG: FtsX-like permease family protein [Verrucomicrobiota bacterium]
MKLSWHQLVWKEARRRPVRAAITISGVAVAVAALASLLSFQRGYQRGLGLELDRLGAHVLVVPKGCPFDAASIALHGANWPCYLRGAYLDEVRSTPGVATAAPALMGAFPKPDGTQTVVVGATEDLLALKPGWRIDGRFPAATHEILLGADVARKLGRKTGDSVVFEDLPGARRISGILEPTGGADDGFIFLPLATAQHDLRHEQTLTHILVRLRDPGQLDDAVNRLRGCNAGMDMNIVPLTHLFRTIQGMLGATHVWMACVAIAALLAAGAGVSNAVLMAVMERTREIGVLRALGASPGDVFRLFWMESLLLCTIGAVTGLLTAAVASHWVESWLRGRLPFSPSDTLVRLEPGVALLCLGGALLLGSLAGFLPAWRASRLSPREAIRAPSGT